MVEEVEVSDGSSTLRPILRPGESGDRNDPAVPPPDTKLSDYYVSDVRHLDDSPLLQPWAIALVGLTGVIFASLIVTMVSLRKSSDDRVGFPSCFRFWKNPDEEDGGMDGPTLPTSINREKDKMVATVLVDIRIQNNERWRRGSRQQQQQHDLNDSLAETDDRLTESDVGSSAGGGPESMSEVSSRRSETMSEPDMSQGDIDPNDLPPPPSVISSSVEEPQLIRRRRVISEVHDEC
jgi:hypothetical protein